MPTSLRMKELSGTAVPVRGDDIDTDRIIPARHLRSITFDGLERFVFDDDRKEAGGAGKAGGARGVHPFDDERYRGATVLVVNRNFGCGSSREHAPQAIHRWGIQVIVGESFSDIFFGNSAVIGLPCVTASPSDIEALLTAVEKVPSTPVTVDLDALACVHGSVRFELTMPRNIRDAFLSGAWDTTGMLLDRFDEVRAVAARLPYVSGFTQR